MKALKFSAKVKKLELKQVPIPEIKRPDEVLIKVAYAGICGTDLHILQGEFPCHPDEPVTLGHEFSGTVVDVGCNVKNVKAGDKVAVDPNDGCNRCIFCHSGNPQFCSDTIGVYNKAGLYKDGGFAEYSVIPINQVHRLPESITLQQGALTEPLSCLSHTYDVISPLRIGMKILITGAGICGNLLSCILHLKGHRKVTVSEPSNARLCLIKKLNTGYNLITPDELKANQKADPNYLFDLIIDCSGYPPAIEHGITLLQKGGKFCIFGVAPTRGEVKINPYEIFTKELKILGGLINPFSFPKALGMMESMGDRFLNYDKLGIQTFDLKDYKDAIECLKTGNKAKAVFKL